MDLHFLYNWIVKLKLCQIEWARTYPGTPYSEIAPTFYNKFSNNIRVKTVSYYSEPGIIFSSDFTWTDHYSDTITKVDKAPYFLHQTISPHPLICIKAYFVHFTNQFFPLLFLSSLLKSRCRKCMLNSCIYMYLKLQRLFGFTKFVTLSLRFEVADITFLTTCIKYPQEHFNAINHNLFISFKTRFLSCFKSKGNLPWSTSYYLNFIHILQLNHQAVQCLASVVVWNYLLPFWSTILVSTFDSIYFPTTLTVLNLAKKH